MAAQAEEARVDIGNLGAEHRREDLGEIGFQRRPRTGALRTVDGRCRQRTAVELAGLIQRKRVEHHQG